MLGGSPSAGFALLGTSPIGTIMSTTETTWVPPSVLARMVEELAVLGASATPNPETVERIRVLREALRHAEASEKPDDGLVEPGMLVTVLFANEAHTSTFLLGSRDLIAVEPTINVDVYSPTSPLGQALHGAVIGDTVQYALPSGRNVAVRVVSAEPFKG